MNMFISDKFIETHQ